MIRSPGDNRAWGMVLAFVFEMLSPLALCAQDAGAVPEQFPRAALPGLVSSPAPLPANRRWQIVTKNVKGQLGNVAWSPDSRWLALATGHVVRLYDLSGEPELKIVLFGHDDFVHAVRFSPDGKLIATASQDGTVRIWDADGRQQSVYRGHEDAVRDVSWHPNGVRLASASLDGSVRIWSLKGDTLAVLTGHEAPVKAVAWNPNGKLLASGCMNKVIRLWSDDGRPGSVLEGHLGAVSSLAWNVDGTKLLSGDHGRESTDSNNETIAHLKIWDASGKPLNTVSVSVPVNQVCWSPDGTYALGGGFFSAWLWPMDGRNSVTNIGGAANITPVAWRPNGEMFAIGGRLQRIDGSRVFTIPRRAADVAALDQHPDGSLVAIGGPEGIIRLFDRDGKQQQQSEPLDQRPIMALRWSKDGQAIIPASRSTTQLQRYNLMAQPVGDPVKLPVTGVRSLDWTRDGRYVATGGDSMIPQLVDLEKSSVIALGRQANGITQVRFTADEQQVCSAGFDGCVRFWSRDGKPGRVIEALSAPIRGLALTSDGKWIATGHEDNMIRIWTSDGTEDRVIGGHGGYVQALDYSPDNSQLASASWDQTVRIWGQDGSAISVLRGHEGSIFALQWTRDGRRVLSGATDGTLRLWDPQTGQAEWVVLLGDANSYVTLDAQGRVKHGDEEVLEDDFVVFAEDADGRVTRANWSYIRAAIQPANTGG